RGEQGERNRGFTPPARKGKGRKQHRIASGGQGRVCWKSSGGCVCGSVARGSSKTGRRGSPSEAAYGLCRKVCSQRSRRRGGARSGDYRSRRAHRAEERDLAPCRPPHAL